ncbi:MAG: TonB-dependent receptor [Thermoanaerobaculia bacterium]|nr:TonB-dependent receptor [Thermoanaerobaculia bacterium]
MTPRTTAPLRSLLTVLAVAALAAHAPSHGQQSQADPDDAGSEEVVDAADQNWSERIVVTATRSEVPLAEVPLHATVVSESAILATPRLGISDLMLGLPNVQFNSGVDSLVAAPRDGSIGFRGLGGLSAQSRGLVLLDGLPINDPYGSYVVWNRVPRDFVSRVEVVPGGGSGLWGNLALSGVVNLITHRPTDQRLRARLRAAEYDTADATVAFGHAGESWSAWVGGSYLDTDGIYELAPEDRGPASVPSAKDFGSLSARLTRSLGDSSSIRIGGTRYSEDRVQGTADDLSHSHEAAFDIGFDHVTGSLATWEVRLFQREVLFEEAISSFGPGLAFTTPSSLSTIPSDTVGLSTSWTTAGGSAHSWTAGFDTQFNEVDRTTRFNWDGAGYPDQQLSSGDQFLGGAFAQGRLSGGAKTSWTLGLRYDVIQASNASFVRSRATGEILDTREFPDNTESNLSPNVGVVHEINAKTRLRASLYSGFRAPTPAELWVPTASRNPSWPDPELEPERLVGIEIGFDLEPLEDLSLRLTAFRNEIDNLIQRFETGRAGPDGGFVEPCGELAPGARCRQRANLGEVGTTGLDLEGELRVGRQWRLLLQGSLLDTEVISSPTDPSVEGNRLVGAPDTAATLSVHYRSARRFTAMVQGRYRDSLWGDIENTELIGSHFLVDVSGSMRLNASWQLYVGVQNLFDEVYPTSLSSDGTTIGAPRIASLGITFSLD